MKSLALASILAFALTLSAQTKNDETANNTSACSNIATGCSAAFGGNTDNQTAAVGSTVQTPNVNATPVAGARIAVTSGGSVSKLLVRNLMPYSGTTKLLAHLMPWFGTSSHISVGYNSNDVNVVLRQLTDMSSRGFDGVVIDWYGGGNDCGAPSSGNTDTSMSFNNPCSSDRQSMDGATTLVSNNLGTPSQWYGVFAVMEDGGSWSTSSTCDNSSSFAAQGLNALNQPQCIASKIQADLDYANITYFGNANYYKMNNRPVVFTFFNQGSFTFPQCVSTACTVATSPTLVQCGVPPLNDCWTQIWSQVSNHIQTYPGGAPLLVFRNRSGFAYPSSTNNLSGGGYGWLDNWVQYCDGTQTGCQNIQGHQPITNCTQNDVKRHFNGCSDTSNSNYIDDFYNGATCTYTGSGCVAGELAFGSAFKGFDDNFWLSGKIGKAKAQRCGQTWLDSWSWMNPSYFDGNHPLEAIQVATWNDYEEGTEIETGIDNCVGTSTQSVAGSTLSWSFPFTDATNGTPATIDHFELFDTTTNGSIFTKINYNIGNCVWQGSSYSCSDGTHVSNCSFVSGTISCTTSLATTGMYSWTAEPHSLYVKAVGKPSILNHLSNVATYNAGAITKPATVYHMHDTSPVISPAAPDSPATSSTFDYSDSVGFIGFYDTNTDPNVPGAAGVISSGSTVTFSAWLKLVNGTSTVNPHADLYVGHIGIGKELICSANDTTHTISSSLTKYTFSCTAPYSVFVGTGDKFKLNLGGNIATTGNGSLSIWYEGTLNGNYDTTFTAPAITSTATPNLKIVSPASATAGTSLTLTGRNFGNTKRTVKFGTVTVNNSTWTDTSITVVVPSGLAAGPLSLAVTGQGSVTSNALTFTAQ